MKYCKEYCEINHIKLIGYEKNQEDEEDFMMNDNS